MNGRNWMDSCSQREIHASPCSNFWPLQSSRSFSLFIYATEMRTVKTVGNFLLPHLLLWVLNAESLCSPRLSRQKQRHVLTLTEQVAYSLHIASQISELLPHYVLPKLNHQHNGWLKGTLCFPDHGFCTSLREARMAFLRIMSTHFPLAYPISGCLWNNYH